MQQAVIEFENILRTKGVQAALRFLNALTPHRFTGVYRYDGTILRNIALFDQYDPNIQHGDDFPMEDAPCAHVGGHGGWLVVKEFLSDPRFLRSFTPIVSYCGALIRTPDGNPFGTVCHFDTKPCDTPPDNAFLLEAVAPLVYSVLHKIRDPNPSMHSM